jgi:hypothetical protein
VDALGFDVQCGEVPSSNCTFDIGLPLYGLVNVSIWVDTGGPTVGLCQLSMLLSLPYNYLNFYVIGASQSVFLNDTAGTYFL